MFKKFRHTLLLLLFAAEHLRGVAVQMVPPVACPQYFEYGRLGNQYIGKVTLPNLTMGMTRVDVEFSQRQTLQTSYYGRLSLYQDQDTTINNLQRGLPVSYKVEFPTPNVLPKLTRIAVNGYDICRASEYTAPSFRLELQHTLQASTTTVQGTQPLGRFDGVFETMLPGGNPYFTQMQQPQQTQTNYQPKIQAQTPVQPQVQVRTTVVAPAPVPATRAPVRTQQAPARRQQDYNAVCGIEGNTVTPFVHFGTVLSRGQFPWLTAIYHKDVSGVRFMCGGSLISSRTIVTAAHCFRAQNNLTAERILVYLGRYNLENYNEEGNVISNVQTLLTHPEYNPELFSDADVAILQLSQAVSFNQYITPVCLWSESSDTSLVVGQKGYVAGWGADERGNSVSSLPKMVDADIVSENDCIRSSETLRRKTSPRTLCAGNRDGTGPCMGDSGGGLVLNRNGRWMLRGIVSAGTTIQRQCNLQEYVVFCDLAKHLTWVQSNVIP